jgi:hypothetical protein
MPEMTLGDVASWSQLYLAAKPSHVRVNVDGLACPPTPSYGMRLSDEGSCLPVRCSLVPSCRSGRWCLSWVCEAPCLDI